MCKKFFIIALAFLSMFSAYSMICVRCCQELHPDEEINRIKASVVQGKIVKSFAHTIGSKREMIRENANAYKRAGACWEELMKRCLVGPLVAFPGINGNCCCGSVFCWKIVGVSGCGCCIATSLCSCYANWQKSKMDEQIENLPEKPADEMMEETPLLVHTEGEIELASMN